MTYSDYKKKVLGEFGQRFPEFSGVGAPFPIFSEQPNRNHIEQFLTQALDNLLVEVQARVFEERNRFKPCEFGHEDWGNTDCNVCMLRGGGYDTCNNILMRLSHFKENGELEAKRKEV